MSDPGYLRLIDVREGREHHTLLPREAQDSLRRAAQTPMDPSPKARAEAIERAIVDCKLSYPQFFKEYR